MTARCACAGNQRRPSRTWLTHLRRHHCDHGAPDAPACHTRRLADVIRRQSTGVTVAVETDHQGRRGEQTGRRPGERAGLLLLLLEARTCSSSSCSSSSRGAWHKSRSDVIKPPRASAATPLLSLTIMVTTDVNGKRASERALRQGNDSNEPILAHQRVCNKMTATVHSHAPQDTTVWQISSAAWRNRNGITRFYIKRRFVALSS